MERITTLMTSSLLLADINQAYDRMTATEEQLSSGMRINKPSDDPYGTGLALQIRSSLAGLSAYANNVSDGTAWMQTSDSALMNINDMAQRVRELTVQAANGTNGQSTRADAAAEVDQLIAAIKQDANAQYAGQYVFSGTRTTTAPYKPGNVDTYQGNTAAVQREIAPSSYVQVNTGLYSLLGSGGSDGKLLSVLRTISSDMKSSSSSAGTKLGTDLQNLDTNLGTLQALQANVGATLNRLSLASSRIQDLQSSQTKILSNTEDADMAKTATDYSTEQASLTAALRAGANIVQTSLLDFLK